MQGSVTAPWLAPTAGQGVETGAFVTAAFADEGAAFTAHGDGVVRVFDGGPEALALTVHKGVVLAMVPDIAPGHALTGGDDGRVRTIGPDGAVTAIADLGSKWVDCVAASRAAGLRAWSAGKAVHVQALGAAVVTLDHPSTVGGLAFDPKGGRLAVAHYGGVTVWERGKRRWSSTKLPWAGSHIGVAWSPNGKYVTSVMQENALHAWRLRDKLHMQMSGYPAKPTSLAWVGDTPHLATSGAEGGVCWPFDGKEGPNKRNPLTIAWRGDERATCVRAVPGTDTLLVGFRDGEVWVSPLDPTAEPKVVRAATGAEVTAMAVLPDLSRLLIGDAAGLVLSVPLRAAA